MCSQYIVRAWYACASEQSEDVLGVVILMEVTLFQQRHYAEIADITRRLLPEIAPGTTEELGTLKLLACLCRRFKQDNNKFRLDLFAQAAGVPVEKLALLI